MDLRAKAGPLPIWAWGAILGVGAVAFIYWRSSNSAASSAAVTDSGTTTTGDTSPLDYSAAGLGASSSTDDSTGTGTMTTAAPVFQDNSSWESGIVQWLTGQGQDPIKVRQALDTYLAGGVITSQSTLSIITKAIGYAGDAPDGLAGTPTESIPAPTPGGSVVGTAPTGTHPGTTPVKKVPTHVATKPTAVAYTVKSGDTLSALAKHYYGSASATNISKIAKANNIKNVNLIKVGQHLSIPK